MTYVPQTVSSTTAVAIASRSSACVTASMAAVTESCVALTNARKGCDHLCANPQESYYCQCRPGYRLFRKFNCEEENECLTASDDILSPTSNPSSTSSSRDTTGL
ncbi:von Willebrand factor C and EGF domain-containing protein-like isoform X2 [Portunus trituberculatus]|uniref:von Willebrand factor C and EGF domain-containing protein-like isoform X2 n=1 Tax=Portunus trituberculatus TaxID=210409 RepID=UPI001E1CF461|nr:von Willebrand factor C and EGF domain-containing protein-like isoform X2 [Portunus trituberculatus]